MKLHLITTRISYALIIVFAMMWPEQNIHSLNAARSKDSLFLNSPIHLGLTPWKGLDQRGIGANEAGDLFGSALAAGDFNGDGITDLVVGAPGEAPGGLPKSGFVFAFEGTPNGLIPWKGLDQRGIGANEAGDLFGSALAAGDFDGDHIADLVVGAPGEAPGGDPKSGFVFTFKGNASP